MIDKIKTLVIARHFILKSYVDKFYDYESETFNEIFHLKWSNYFKVISELLDIKIETRDLFSEEFNMDKIISSHINSSIYEDILIYDINEKFGSEIKQLYIILNTIVTLNYISSFHTFGEKFENVSTSRKKLIKNEFQLGDEFIKFYKDNFSELSFLHYKYFNSNVIEHLKKLNQIFKTEKINHISIHDTTSEIINNIFTQFDEIDFNLNIAEELIEKLENCKPGKKEWSKYEDICLEILRFIFIPEFDFIYTQVRTDNNHQIRDAILPNNQDFGFWKNIKDEFNSKNIVCEFKNGIQKNINKNSINQLRVYLSKKTIGKYGFLFIRKKPNNSVLHARKLAYQESNILITIIDDELLKKLILCRALFGKCDEVLKKEKIKFEVEY